MNELEVFEVNLKIDKEFYHTKLDNDGHITELFIYDCDYMVFEYEGDLIQAISPFIKLKTLEIEVSDYTITDISGLANFKHLEKLELIDCCKLNDISALENLANLKQLTINNAGINNIEPLKSLKNLSALYLSGNEITNLDALNEHLNMVNINFSYNKLRDVSALVNCQQIKVLNLDHNELTDISFVAKLTHLEHLYFTDNNIVSVDFLKSLSALKTLTFSRNPVADITPLTNLINLQYLNMQGVSVNSLVPIKHATDIINLSAGPIEVFDDSIFQHFTELTNLQLEHCGISDLSFLSSMKKLQVLNLSNNRIADVTPIIKLTSLRILDLQNNIINTPFPQLSPDNLSRLDLRENPFGNKIYGMDYGSDTLSGLYKDTADYWFQLGDDDKALGYYYIDAVEKISLIIYYKKLIACNSADEYFRLYYVMRCEFIIRHLKEEDKDVLDMHVHLIHIIKNSNFFNRTDLLTSLEDGGRNVQNYNLYSEYTAYLNIGQATKPHPEMLYRLGSNSFNKRVDLNRLLSLYKQLVELESPLSFKLYYTTKKILRGSFGYTPEERDSYSYYQDLLNNASELEIPFFDTIAWFKENYSHCIHDRNARARTKEQILNESQYTGPSNWNVVRNIALAIMALMVLLRACGR